jgi:hypothetical protein
MLKENRKHFRSKVKCPVEFITSCGSMHGEIRNLSKSGAFISSSKVIEPLNAFPVVISPKKGKSLTVMAELVWSKTFFKGNLVFHVMGVHFTYVFGDGRESLEDILETCIISWREKKPGM